jgi:hypothetical protein
MWREDDGDIVSKWLLQLVVVMAVIALVGYEAISIAVSHLALDEDARQVAAETRTAYRDGRDVEEAMEAGVAAAEEQGIDVTDVSSADDDTTITYDLQRTASTLLLHRIGQLEGLTITRTSRTVSLSP